MRLCIREETTHLIAGIAIVVSVVIAAIGLLIAFILLLQGISGMK
ncbi:hypothetical protein RAAC3_TM7C00001G0721 [Candidatus Saccharibacteria bacterium RAAC3_TM7_1]|nr:hypothetical protein RAAC3_TM7C00001G0721 [Candidatus Saccharibacteria bacterium RAAC3_TM7_1]